MRIKLTALALLAFLYVIPVFAGEGMWIPLLLESLNEDEMQTMGMEITAEDIYSVNKSSLKDAIVKFGNGCTGEIISGDGLLLTNHHCGFGQIQRHSTLENDYLQNGFWAMSREEELTNPGLSVTFIVRIEDVTSQVLEGVTDEMDEEARQKAITEHINDIHQKATENTHYKAEIKPFYYGNEYYMFITEEFSDVRLVGAPPSSIGKFGGETDNWVWPRHNGDFSLFRVYSGPDGKPADYSPRNIPLKPRHFLPVSLEGIDENDFTMVYGFPASTQQYLPSFAVEMIVNMQDPVRIGLRDKRLKVMNREMKKSNEIRLQYANKEKNISNGYKKWKGEIRGLERNNTIEKKKEFEAEFMKRVASNPVWQTRYGGLLDQYETYYGQMEPALKQLLFFQEGGDAIEVVEIAWKMAEALGEISETQNEERHEEELEKLRRFGRKFFKEYQPHIDREIMGLLLEAYHNEFSEEEQPEIIPVIARQFNGDFQAYANYVFENSSMVDEVRFHKLVNNFDAGTVQNDPVFSLMASIYQNYFKYIPVYQTANNNIQRLHRTYMQAQRELFPDRTFYPDANFTLRVSYGKVEGMAPNDGVKYKHYTTLQGIVEKGIPGDYDFDIPAKLVELYQKKDYGPYADESGELRVAFIASNHTSGGNSGSPVINGKGHLVGLNFDRNWEGTMSDINYDVRQCRNISVDIRYVLFVVDKFAGAGYLLDEMKLIRSGE